MKRRLPAILTATLLLAGTPFAQQQQPAPAPASQEMATRELEAPANFRSKVNLVLVPVIVRDKKGNPIGTLKKEDFELFDKGKPQVIDKFSVEQAGSHHVEFEPAPPAAEDPNAPPAPAPMEVAERYTAFLFDDLHLTISDLMQVKIAATKHLAGELVTTERFAVYTTSGRVNQDFTDDRDVVAMALKSIQANSRVAANRQGCPPMTFYMADMIVNKNDPFALNAATQDTLVCANIDPSQPGALQQAQSQAKAAAQQTMTIGEADMRLTLQNLRAVVRRLSTMPGQRNVVLISPGFIVIDTHSDVTEIIDLSIRSRVSINSLDARGLHLIGIVPDASERVFDTGASLVKSGYDRQDALAGSMMLGELSEGTGGLLFQNNNDLTGGFAKLTTTPEYTYILGFSPQNLKTDGSLHILRVRLKVKDSSLALQARHGYYAPKHLADPAEEARREIQEALFSRDVLRDLPIELHTQFFKGSEYDAKLGVLARVDLTKLQFKKAEGRNLNNLTVVAALFDRNGNYLMGSSKLVEMKLKDETLQNKTRSLITIKTNFDVKIGGYVIRLVVRDSEGQLMAAQNGSIVIP